MSKYVVYSFCDNDRGLDYYGYQVIETEFEWQAVDVATDNINGWADDTGYKSSDDELGDEIVTQTLSKPLDEFGPAPHDEKLTNVGAKMCWGFEGCYIRAVPTLVTKF